MNKSDMQDLLNQQQNAMKVILNAEKALDITFSQSMKGQSKQDQQKLLILRGQVNTLLTKAKKGENVGKQIEALKALYKNGR